MNILPLLESLVNEILAAEELKKKPEGLSFS